MAATSMASRLLPSSAASACTRRNRRWPHAEPGDPGAGDFAALHYQCADHADQGKIAGALGDFAEQGDMALLASPGKWIAVTSSSGSSTFI